MRRSHRTGAAVTAAATLLTGAGFAVASLDRSTAPTPVEVVSDTQPVGNDEDLDATLRDLRDQADDLTTELRDREKAARLAKERDRATARDAADRTADPTTPAARTLPTAPATHATTGASGSGGDEDDEENDEGGHESEREGDDD